MARDFEPYEGHHHKEEEKCSCCGCLTDCGKKICKHMTKQIWKLFIFVGIYALCVAGIYWGATEVKSLNNFSEVPAGCTIVSVDMANVSCNECDCDYYYNPIKFDKQRVCSSCNSVKHKYIVTADHCGTQNLTMDDDYWYDKACGVPLKKIGKKYNCYLYKDCRGQYSFDTMYADQDELVYPIVIIVVCVAVMIITCLLKCICC